MKKSVVFIMGHYNADVFVFFESMMGGMAHWLDVSLGEKSSTLFSLHVLMGA